ncbi:MAG: flavodoxin family protein [Thermoproteota archaeon]
MFSVIYLSSSYIEKGVATFMGMVYLKILGIVGSPHDRFGNTYNLVDRLLTESNKMGAETKMVLLQELNIGYCTGCGLCLREGECPQEDDMKSLVEEMAKSDGIVLGSPMYYLHVTAQMKTFIDRTLAWGHRPRFQGKYGASIVVYAGVGYPESLAEYLNGVLMAWGVTPVGKVCAYAVAPGDLDEESLERASVLGAELVRAITEKRIYPESEDANQVRRMLIDLIRSRRQLFKADYDFWERRGWV